MYSAVRLLQGYAHKTKYLYEFYNSGEVQNVDFANIIGFEPTFGHLLN